MNDFTKDELEILVHSLYGGMHDDFPVLEENRELQIKLQSMIDNYCEHSERVATSDEDGHMLVMCGRCDLVLWHEKD